MKIQLNDYVELYLNGSGGELHPDGRLRLEVELVPGEAGEQVGLPHARVTDQNN